MRIGNLALLFAGLSCIIGSCAKPDHHTVRIGYPPIIASLPVFIAEDDQLFETAGLKAEYTEFAKSDDLVAGLVAGKLDLLPAVSLIPLLHLEIAQPGTVRVFSVSRMRSERAFDSIIVRVDSDILDLTQLAGKRIGLFPGSSASNMLEAFLKDSGVDTSKIVMVPLAPPAHLSSLDAKAIDALFSYEPVTTTALLGKEYRTLHGSVYAKLLEPCPIGASVISRSFERDHPVVARKSVEAIDKAVIRMRERGAAGSAELLEAHMELPAEVSARVNVVDVTLSSELDVVNLQQFIDFLVEIGELPERVDATKLIAETLQK